MPGMVVWRVSDRSFETGLTTAVRISRAGQTDFRSMEIRCHQSVKCKSWPVSGNWASVKQTAYG